jgi:hypothetical protein
MKETYDGKISEMITAQEQYEGKIQDEIRNIKLDFEKEIQVAVEEAVESTSAQTETIMLGLIHRLEATWKDAKSELDATKKWYGFKS